MNISSDAAVEAYEGWGGYGSSKAALDHLSAVLAAEESDGAGVRVRPRRHAHRHAPARVPGRGHLRPARAGDRRAGAVAAHRRAAGQRSVPRRRAVRRRDSGRWPSGDRVRLRPARDLEASPPPPRRDRVRLLVAGRTGIQHARFDEFASFLAPGDLVVVNTSATLPAAVDGRRADGRAVTVHFSTALDDGAWLVELRPPVNATGPLRDVTAGERVELPDGVCGSSWRRPTPAAGSAAVALERRGRGRRRGVPGPRRPTHPLHLRLRAVPAQRRTRPCSRASRAARRCRAPAGRSPPRSSPTW